MPVHQDEKALSLLDRIKAAMGTYDYLADRSGTPCGLRFDVFHTVTDEIMGSFARRQEARTLRRDLNARAVLDAIVGELRWEKDGVVSKCFLAYSCVGSVLYYPGQSIYHARPHGDRVVYGSWHANELEARKAVEAAFLAAMEGK